MTVMGEHTPTDAVEIKVKDEEIIKLDHLKIKALYTPGHTSDSFSFLMDIYFIFWEIHCLLMEQEELIFKMVILKMLTIHFLTDF